MKKFSINSIFIGTSLLFNMCTLLSDGMNSNVIYLENEEQYEQLLKDSKPCILKFAANWCGACQSVEQHFEEVANDPELSNVNFVEVNIDKFKKLAQNNGVVGIPTFVYVQNGSSKHQEVGVKNPNGFKDSIRENIRNYFGSLNQSVDAQVDTKTEVTTKETEVKPEEHKEVTTTEHKKVEEHAPAGVPGFLIKVKVMFMSAFDKIKIMFVDFVNWVKSLFGK